MHRRRVTIDQDNRKKAYIAAICNAFIIGLSFIFVKMALTKADPIDTLSHRFTISLVTASIPVLFGWVKLTLRVKHVLVILPLAVFYPALFFASQAFGLSYTSSSEAGIIHATVPIFTLVFAYYFLKESSSVWQKASIFLSVVGVVYIFAMKGVQPKMTNINGTILILLSVLSLASYSILARKLTQKFKVMDLTYVMTVIGFLFFNSLSAIHHLSEGSLSTFFTPYQSPPFVIAILYLGILSTLVTSLLSNYALSKIEASKISVFNQLATLVAIAAGAIFLQENLEHFHLVGAGLIILGVLGTNFLKPVKAKVKL